MRVLKGQRDVVHGLVIQRLLPGQGQHRSLQAAEAEIEVAAVDHRARQLEAPRHALLGQHG